MVLLCLWAGCCEAPPTSTATGNPITFCSIRLCVRPSSGTSAGVRSPVVRTGQRCRLVIPWFRSEYTAIFLRLILYGHHATRARRKQGGWEVFEADGVSPVYCGEGGRESALSYARQRAGYGRAEIQVLDEAWNVVETIGNEEARPLV